jgi:formamidopyrimidine-DNA glycosylase
VPEIPDLTLYVEALERHVVGRVLEGVRVVGPFFLRTVDPPLAEAAGRRVVDVRRIGKRIVVELDGGLFLVMHLMVSGRFRWRKPGAKVPLKTTNAVLDFGDGELHVTEASSRKRASLHVVRGREALRSFDAGGIEPLEADGDAFSDALRRENHTLKRTLTDPRLFAGIGNAYSDEILHRARLSPFALSQRLGDADVVRLRQATRAILSEWTTRLRQEVGDGFPKKVTAFRHGMAVHGRYGKPCPDCGSPVQRIRYAENEANYCATCQTEGRLLRDRGLSRLLKDDWPRSLEEMDRRLGRA